MKNYIIVLLMLSIVTLSAFKCKKEAVVNKPSCYKGRLEVKGTCINYTIKLLEGNVISDKIEKNWKDPITGKEYTNVFRLENICNFPATLKEGDEFYFELENNPSTECFRCLAFYPTPAKGMSIKVISGTCSDKRD
jgi:hypothetical protein